MPISESATQVLRASLRRPTPAAPLVAVGAVDAIAARVAVDAGFEALWISGLEVSASLGLPDTNVVSVQDLLRPITAARAVTHHPVIVDIDNAGGSLESARRYGRELCQAGASAVCIEDSSYPKCNSFSLDRAQALADIALTAGQIREIRDAVGDGLVIIGRTEALICRSGLGVAVARATEMVQSGADAVLIHSKDSTGDEILSVARAAVPAPLVVVPTAVPALSWQALGAAGFRLCIYANQLSRSAISAMQSTANQILGIGTVATDNPMSSMDALIRTGAPNSGACI